MLAKVTSTETPLRRELARRGIRYSWMARELGVQPWTFARIEDRRATPPKDYYERAAEILQVPVAAIKPTEDAAVAA